MKRENSGTLNRNDDKQKEGANPKWPDYKGQASVGDQDYWISAWLKDDGKGGKFMSLSFTVKEQKGTRKQSRPVPDDDSSIPF